MSVIIGLFWMVLVVLIFAACSISGPLKDHEANKYNSWRD